MKCPNCTKVHGPIDACAIGVLMQVVEDRRGRLSKDDRERILEAVDVDWMWEQFLGPAVDSIEGLLAGGTLPAARYAHVGKVFKDVAEEQILRAVKESAEDPAA